MFIDLTPEQRQLQAEIRQYFSNLISPDERTEMEKSAVPRWFARNKDRRQHLAQAWRKHIGPPRQLPADSPQGQAILDLFRGDNPLSVTTQLRTTWR